MADPLTDAVRATNVEDGLVRRTAHHRLYKLETLGHEGLGTPGHGLLRVKPRRCTPAYQSSRSTTYQSSRSVPRQSRDVRLPSRSPIRRTLPYIRPPKRRPHRLPHRHHRVLRGRRGVVAHVELDA